MVTMQLQLQRHGGERRDCRNAGRDRRITATTQRCRPLCRVSEHSFVAQWLSRDPVGELGHRLLDHTSLTAQERPQTTSVLSMESNRNRNWGCNFGRCIVRQISSRSAPERKVISSDFRFCLNDPIGLVDVDGRKVPSSVCQYYILQGVVGTALGVTEKLLIKHRCEDLAETPDQQSYGRSPGARLLTIVNISAILAHCGLCGGQVYLHVWYDDDFNCKWDYVVICNGCSA